MRGAEPFSDAAQRPGRTSMHEMAVSHARMSQPRPSRDQKASFGTNPKEQAGNAKTRASDGGGWGVVSGPRTLTSQGDEGDKGSQDRDTAATEVG